MEESSFSLIILYHISWDCLTHWTDGIIVKNWRHSGLLVTLLGTSINTTHLGGSGRGRPWHDRQWVAAETQWCGEGRSASAPSQHSCHSSSRMFIGLFLYKLTGLHKTLQEWIQMKISSSSLAEKALTATSHDVPWAQYDTASCVLPSVFSTPVSAVTTQYTFINSSAELLTDTDRVVFWHYTQRHLDAFDQWCLRQNSVHPIYSPCQ